MAARASQYRRVEPALVESRRAPRHRVAITRATVRRHGETAGEAELHDLSIYGCRLRSNEAYGPGERLWLRLEGSMPVAATVMWSEGGAIGARFDTTIDRSLVRALTLTIV